MKKENQVTIREAKLEDVDGIMKVEEACFPEGVRYSREKVAGRIAHPKDSFSRIRKYFIALHENEIAGYGEVAIQDYDAALFSCIEPVKKVVKTIDDTVGAFISMAVHPSKQGMGVGSRIIQARIDFLKENGMKQLFVHAWPNGGFPHLAKKFGFVEIPGWNGLSYSDGGKAILYYKNLKEDS